MPYTFPHLTELDSHLFHLYLEQFQPLYPNIDFDVRIGQGRDPGPDYDQNIRDMAITLSQKRIDAVGHFPDSIEIIEITHRASLKSIGQLTVYPILYQLTYFPTKPLIRVLVTFSISEDLAAAAVNLPIDVRIVKPDNHATALIHANRTRE